MFPCGKCLKHGKCASEEAIATGGAVICSPSPNTPSWLEEAEAVPFDPTSATFTHSVGKLLGPNLDLVLNAVREHLSLHPDRFEDVPSPNLEPDEG